MKTTLKKISIPHIKEQMKEVYYLSDDLVITPMDARDHLTGKHPTMIDGFTAVIVVSGSARTAIDTVEYEVVPNTVILTTPNRVIKILQCSDNLSAYFVACSQAFIDNMHVDLPTSLPVFMQIDKEPCLQVNTQDAQEIRLVFQLIKTILGSDKEAHRREIVHHLFTAAFYIIVELDTRRRRDTLPRGRGEVIFEEFRQLLGKYGTHERHVSFYARELCITPKYLSTISKNVSGKTAAKWIDEAVILEAKSLLRYSGMSVQQVADQLNFSTQSFFGKYFKQHTGHSPSHFKRGGGL